MLSINIWFMEKAGEGDHFRSEQGNLGSLQDGGWVGELPCPLGSGGGPSKGADVRAVVGECCLVMRVGPKPPDQNQDLSQALRSSDVGRGASGHLTTQGLGWPQEGGPCCLLLLSQAPWGALRLSWWR